MSDSQTHHHHHHHHHKMDGASKFKRKNLLAIERRKKIAKWSFRILIAIAIVVGIGCLTIYTIGKDRSPIQPKYINKLR